MGEDVLLVEGDGVEEAAEEEEKKAANKDRECDDPTRNSKTCRI